jgi:hypothetical protein
MYINIKYNTESDSLFSSLGENTFLSNCQELQISHSPKSAKLNGRTSFSNKKQDLRLVSRLPVRGPFGAFLSKGPSSNNLFRKQIFFDLLKKTKNCRN